MKYKSRHFKIVGGMVIEIDGKDERLIPMCANSPTFNKSQLEKMRSKNWVV